MAKWIVLLLLVCAPLGALEVHGEFQVGHDLDSDKAFALVRLDLIQVPVTLYGSSRTWFLYESPYGYPFRNIYEVGVQVGWRDLFFDVNHFCNHPVLSNIWMDSKWGENMTTLSVGVRW